MNKFTPLLISVSLTYLVCSFAHAQEPIWVNHYGNSNTSKGFKLEYDGQGGLYGVGTVGAPALDMNDTSVTVLGTRDILLAKWDTTGMLIWARTAGGDCQPSGLESAGAIAYDPTIDQVVISGQFDCYETYFGSQLLNGSESGGRDLFVAAYNVSGDCLWARSARGFDTSHLLLLVDGSSNIFVFGWARTGGIEFHGPPSITLPQGGFIAKFDSNGTLISAQRVVVNGELGQADWVNSNTWVLTGTAKPNASLFGQSMQTTSAQQDGFVAKTDTTGTVEWITMFASTGSASVFRSAVLSDGRIAVSGYFVGDLILPQYTLNGPQGSWTFFLAVLNEAGQVEWAMPFTTGSTTTISDIHSDTNGDVLVYGRHDGILPLGNATLNPYASTSGFVTRFSSVGECKAAWSFGRTYFASGSILPTDHGLYLSTEFDSTLVIGSHMVQGTSTGPDPWYHDLFIARFDSLSGFTSVPTLKANVDERLHIYANPNRGVCTIELPAAVKPGSDLLLTIHDATGRVVQRVPLYWSHGTVQVDIRAQARGIYHAELIDGQQRYSGKIVFE